MMNGPTGTPSVPPQTEGPPEGGPAIPMERATGLEPAT